MSQSHRPTEDRPLGARPHLVEADDPVIEERGLATDAPRERICLDCDRRVTVTPDGVECGHQRGNTGSRPRCPHRPVCVDPHKPSKASSWGVPR